jgi:hypothetical protein
MTPKEKAIELFDKFRVKVHDRDGTSAMNGFEAIQCALIAVDEIIKYHDDLMDVVRYELPSHIVAILPYKYWEEVKKEIEAL